MDADGGHFVVEGHGFLSSFYGDRSERVRLMVALAAQLASALRYAEICRFLKPTLPIKPFMITDWADLPPPTSGSLESLQNLRRGTG